MSNIKKYEGELIMIHKILRFHFFEHKWMVCIFLVYFQSPKQNIFFDYNS